MPDRTDLIEFRQARHGRLLTLSSLHKSSNYPRLSESEVPGKRSKLKPVTFTTDLNKLPSTTNNLSVECASCFEFTPRSVMESTALERLIQVKDHQ